jgi:hypothetical protein
VRALYVEKYIVKMERGMLDKNQIIEKMKRETPSEKLVEL